MAEPTAWWTTAGREVMNVVIRGVPQRFLRWRWPVSRLLNSLTIFAEAQPSVFFIGPDRPSHEFDHMHFHVFNMSPMQLALVGAEIDVHLNSMILITSKERFATEIPLPPFARGGFPIREMLSERQSQAIKGQTVKEENGKLIRIRVTGKVIVKSPFGEHRKDLHADTTAAIVL